jgi:hypothetical protein
VARGQDTGNDPSRKVDPNAFGLIQSPEAIRALAHTVGPSSPYNSNPSAPNYAKIGGVLQDTKGLTAKDAKNKAAGWLTDRL